MKLKKTTLIALSLILISNFASALDTSTYNCPMGGMMYGVYGGYGGVGQILSGLTYLLVIALLIAGIYWLVKSANRKK